MAVEYQLCKRKGGDIAILSDFEEIYEELEKINKKDILDALFVLKECVENKTPAWFFPQKIEKSMVFIKVEPLKKKKLTKETIGLMIEGYLESSDEDLAIAKEFEQVENELDDTCDK